MKIPHAAFAFLLSALVFPVLTASAEKIILIDEQFESPTGKTAVYPPPTVNDFAYVTTTGESRVSGWSQGGQVSVTYAEKTGVKDSGGIACKLDKVGVYAQLTIEAIPLPNVDKASALIPEKVLTIEVSFAAKIPDGEEIEVSLGPVLPAESSDDAYANRLVFPPIKGTGAFETYKFSVKDLPLAQAEGFVGVLKNVLTAGAEKVFFNLSLTLGKQWPTGASFQFDDALVTIEK